MPDANLVRNLKVPDRAIDPKILNEILDEDKLGTGSKSADVSARGEVPDPAKEKPDGSAPKAPSKKTVRRGSNEQTITYDPQTGRPVSSTGTIRQDFGSGPRYDNTTAVGRLGNPGDQGGHLAGHRFFGDTPDEGIAPQAGNLNMGAWKTMENEWADWTKLGYEVEYKVDVYPPGAVRPDTFQSTYQVRDPKTGEVVYKNKEAFDNDASQTFIRIKWRDMQEKYARNK